MKVISRIAILVAVALVAAASVQTVNATCAIGHIIGGCGSGGCKYIHVNGSNPSAALVGNFWGLGGGNPVLLAGDDNGSDLAIGNATPIDWVHTDGTSYYLAGAWSNDQVDGCVDNASTPSPKRTMVTLADQSGSAGYFLALCALALGDGNYDFSTGAGDHNLALIPRAPIATSSRVSGVSASLNLSPPPAGAVAAGTVALDPLCTGMVRGYKVYTQLRPNAAGAPSDLHTTAGWVAQGNEVPVASPTAATVPCSAASSVWVANTLVFDSGFETGMVSAAQQVACDPTLSDRPDNFKIIKKPRTTQQHRQQN